LSRSGHSLQYSHCNADQCIWQFNISAHSRPANSHGFTVRLTAWGINSQSHNLASKSHDESENLEIAEQFRQYEAILKNLCRKWPNLSHGMFEGNLQFQPHSHET